MGITFREDWNSWWPSFRRKGLSPPNAPSLQAHEDSEKLREIVVPMEQEIAELKVKLLRAEELIQEMQVRGRGAAQGRDGRRGAWDSGFQPLLCNFP